MSNIQTDNLESQPISASPTVASPSVTATKKSRKKLFILLGALVVVLCLCATVCVVLTGTGILKALTERGAVEKVVDEFMRAMADRDAEKAYTFFSPRAQRRIRVADLEKQLQGNNYVLFDGYQKSTVQNINLSANLNTNPDLPQGMVAKVNGTLTYRNGFTGRFDAILEQEGDTWRLFNINVVVPPDKFSR